MGVSVGAQPVACGADGLMIECHPEPDKSVSDARQAISLPEMVNLVDSLRPVAAAVGRYVLDYEVPAQTSTSRTPDPARISA